MGCTSSNQAVATKEPTNLAPATITNDGQQLINDHFRKWLKTNRPKADEYVLNDVLSTAPPPNEAEDYKNIVGKALDLLAERRDIKSTQRLGKLLQKEIVLASPRKVAHTVDILKQTADKLRSGSIQLDIEPSATVETADEIVNDAALTDTQQTEAISAEPGIALKEALEKARILFYKGKQAAIFANPNGGYDVRILDENDETIKHDGNLLRSIVVTEVKMRPKQKPTGSPIFNAPPPPSTKLLDENEVSDDFRRSIDAALKGLEAVYQTSKAMSPPEPEHVQEVHEETANEKIVSSPSSAPLIVQCGVTNIPIAKSTSKDQKLSGTDASIVKDHTANLAEIIRQMAEQQRVVSEQLSKNLNEEHENELAQIDSEVKFTENIDSMNELVMDAVEATTCSEVGKATVVSEHEPTETVAPLAAKEESEGNIERMVREMKEHGEKFESKEGLPEMTEETKQPSSYSIGLTSPIQSEGTAAAVTTTKTKMKSSSSASQQKGKLRSENRPKSFIAGDEVSSKKDIYNLNKQTSLDELMNLTRTGLSNPNLATSITKLGVSTSSGKIEEEESIPIKTAERSAKMPASISQIIEEHRTILEEPSSTVCPTAPVVTPIDTHMRAKSPTHNVTYTEIIHTESRDGEEVHRFRSESSNQNPLSDDEQTTTLKVITKSEFSNHPTSGEKIMEQSVQVITVKVRNETIKTTIQQTTLPSTAENDNTYERRPVSELVKNFEVVAASQNGSVNT